MECCCMAGNKKKKELMCKKNLLYCDKMLTHELPYVIDISSYCLDLHVQNNLYWYQDLDCATVILSKIEQPLLLIYNFTYVINVKYPTF